MSTDTKIKTLIFNKLTQEQYNNADRVPTEFYLTPDTSIDSSEKGAANGVASLDTNSKVLTEQIPVATASALGGVKPDGTTITVTEDGTISAVGGSGSGTTGLSIGDVVFSYSSLASENPGKLPLFTGETIASANTIYPEFYNWVLAHTELQCTSAEYESALSTYGECAKYVIGDGSLRLPLIKNYIKAANPSEGIKNIEAGLPDHTHNIVGSANYNGTINNAFGNGTSNPATLTNLIRPASESNPIYGKSSTVTPTSTTLYPWVVAYTSAIPASVAQAAQFQQGLSGKADTNLGNLSTAGKDLASGLGMPSSRYINLTLGASGSTYTAPANGWVRFERGSTSGNKYIELYNTTAHIVVNCISISGVINANIILPVKKNDVFKVSYTADTSNPIFIFVYAEGAE